ncbi:helix-turn-helix domain-containing protein [Enterococcus hulanensis]|uniref:Helix-turn-helix domain-containing protein n=1 Tax=Enterococcus hulanensis TaxID=2559929 RepID=A0ABU3F5D4_9ENTE|nr:MULTISPECIES: helix-turn-helix domain-containing protein [Enterococcus]MBO0413405.1 helix-turn-helix domain-containing protein [Enterococcus hulanensis]MBO0455308.1 helix-turn-helix domain-containing protein [Enterococcus hulanensis]MBX8938010.1 helix-turn-helix domain-containing protein [Enterococcus gilvus]MDT2602338.1 helix-turn-helix domain-containing protein [Enterococcus hulanensis]MDT2611733.1 helix-turn-helix domain-containing protein [Enterococcus hulanensis]
MVRVLVLTKNILAEEIITNKLQHLNYEVFCSTSILDEIQMDGRIPELVNHFPIIIIGETISSYEMELMLPRLKRHSKSILREVDHYLSEDERTALNELGLTGIVQNSDSVEVLREQLAEVATQYHGRTFEPVVTEECSPAVEEDKGLSAMTLINLSSLELQVLEKLRSQPGEIISRDELCMALWGNVSQSRLAQLSSLVKNIKLKLEILEVDQEIIQTIWGKGYRVRKDVAVQNK